MVDYYKEVKDAWERWADERKEPDTECKRCTPQHYWKSNNCSRCEETKEEE